MVGAGRGQGGGLVRHHGMRSAHQEPLPGASDVDQSITRERETSAKGTAACTHPLPLHPSEPLACTPSSPPSLGQPIRDDTCHILNTGSAWEWATGAALCERGLGANLAQLA